MAIPRCVYTHPGYLWEYLVDTLEPVSIRIAEPDHVVLVDFLLHHEDAEQFRSATLSKAGSPHGPAQLEHLLMLEVLDMMHPRAASYGGYLTWARRARAWATAVCQQDFLDRANSGQNV